MISVVESGNSLRPFTYSDEYAILPDEDAIVDAFLAFLDWAVAFIQEIVDTVFGPIVEAIERLFNDYCEGVNAAVNSAAQDILEIGFISPLSLSGLMVSLNGDLYFVLLAIAATVSLTIILLKALTGPFSFLLQFAFTAILSLLVQEAMGGSIEERYECDVPPDPSESTIQGLSEALVGDPDFEGPTDSQMFWGILSGVITGLASFFGLTLLAVGGLARQAYLWSGITFAIGMLSVALGTYALLNDAWLLGTIGVVASLSCLAIAGLSLDSFRNMEDTSPKEITILTLLTGGIGLFCSLVSIPRND
jgi:hypothetical protein